MSPPRLQASLSLLLLLGGCLLEAARRDTGAARSEVEPAPGPASNSGRFFSPEKHECSWQLLQTVLGAAASSELALSCQDPDGARYQCAYRGEPQRCAAYAARGSHYWKQVLSRLRKKLRPCHDPAPLKVRLCAGKKGHSAELRLVPGAPPPTGPTAVGFPRKPKPLTRGRGLIRKHASGSAAPAPTPPSARSKVKPSEKTKGSKRKELLLGTRPDPDGLDENAELTETYCAEKWHSLCNFFVNFWNG
ncbi:fibroblast growth factor-binding protein 3 [Choloepus didactylus]|uniref:fibroblast growth factor-binding protein 3 n=1 Tax=Choloepus didactylus TaxID=27675 RepID=UPI0018A06C27|nr:fibroblast growth factor-binding protein 3 [Choloepus didactylus]